MPKTTQVNRHKIVFLHQQVDSQRAISWKLGVGCGVSLKKKNLRKLDKRRTKEEVAGLKAIYSRQNVTESDALKK